MIRKGAWIASICALLSACASSGGGGTPSAPENPRTGPGNGNPTLQPYSFETAEYFGEGDLNVYALDRINASAAYAAGGTGEGVTIAIIDSGIDATHPEFSGQISNQSRDIAASRSFGEDEDGHGTFIAGIIGAARDDAGMHGVAYDANLMVLRADIPGSCSAGECQYFASVVANAIDAAIARDADIINLSLGGLTVSDPQIDAALARATNAGVVVVAAAGNTGGASPEAPASFASTAEANGLAIAVGAVDASGNIAGFSNRAGDGAPAYLLAPGVNITSTLPLDACAPIATSCYGTRSGTSYAAPHIAGSIALLLDAFPNISAQDAVSILLDTADDLGDPGIDAVHGAGLINLEAAFTPQGTTSVSLMAQSSGVQSSTAHANTPTQPVLIPTTIDTLFAPPSGPFGDWVWASGAFDGVIARDAYNRAFTITPPAVTPPSAAATHFMSAAAALRQNFAATPTPFGAAYLRLDHEDMPDTGQNNITRQGDGNHQFSAQFNLGRLQLHTGRGAMVGGVTAHTQPIHTPLSAQAWTSNPLTVSGTTPGTIPGTTNRSWHAISYARGPWRTHLRTTANQDRSQAQSAALAHRMATGWLSFSWTTHTGPPDAHDTSNAPHIGALQSGRTHTAQLAWSGPVPSPQANSNSNRKTNTWQVSARASWSTMTLSPQPAATITAQPQTSAWTLALQRPLQPLRPLRPLRPLGPKMARTPSQPNTMGEGVISFALWQPQRAETGALTLTTPVGVTNTARGTIFETRTASLKPSGREVNLETALAWRTRANVDVTASWLLTHQPGHIASARAQSALWFSLKAGY